MTEEERKECGKIDEKLEKEVNENIKKALNKKYFLTFEEIRQIIYSTVFHGA